MRFAYFFACLLAVGLTTGQPATAQNNYFFPGATASSFDPAVPTPEQFLGYPIGSHYTRSDQIVAYLRELDRVSDKVSLRALGTTFEERPQVVATITSAANLQNLAAIRQERRALVDPTLAAPDYSKLPVVVSLNFGVHGNESSSSEAALLLAYYLGFHQPRNHPVAGPGRGDPRPARKPRRTRPRLALVRPEQIVAQRDRPARPRAHRGLARRPH